MPRVISGRGSLNLVVPRQASSGPTLHQACQLVPLHHTCDLPGRVYLVIPGQVIELVEVLVVHITVDV